MKKAICFLMATCMLAGSGYTGEVSTSVSVTPVVQEATTEVEKTDNKMNFEGISSVLERTMSSLKGLSFDFANRIRVASAEEKEEEEAKYEYVLRYTNGDNQIIRSYIDVARMLVGKSDTLHVSALKVGTENEFGSMENVRAYFYVSDIHKDILTVNHQNEELSFTVTAKKPGYATLNGLIWKVDENGNTIQESQKEFATTFHIEAKLDRNDEVWKDIDIEPTEDNRILVLDPETLIDPETGEHTDKYQLKFKGINLEDKTKDGEISESIKFTTLPSMSVAKLSENGLITIQGAGVTTFSIQNYVAIQTGDQDVGDAYTVTLIVLPTGAKEVKNEENYQKNVYHEVPGVPGESGSEFTLYTNAIGAENRLIWEIYYGVGKNKKLVEVIDNVTKNPVPELEEHSLFEYYFEDKNILFTDVKAGTYQIKAYVTKEYSAVECLTVDVVVWLNLQSGEFYVNVGDYYDIEANSNIPKGMYKYVYSGLLTENPNNPDAGKTTGSSARLNDTGIVTAISYGEDYYQLIYDANSGLYSAENVAKLKEVVYGFKVIDTLSISTSTAIMYTGGELTLKANTTQHGTIYWDYKYEADKEFIEIGSNGVIKAKKKTPDKYSATVVAYQIVGGVTKRAECKIQVYETATTIRLEPDDVEIAVNETKTIEAILEPDNLNFVNYPVLK